MLDERKITAGLERLAARVEPDPQLWDRIKEEINRDHSPRSRRHVSVAAIASVVLLGMSVASTPVIARHFKVAHQPKPISIAAAYKPGEEPAKQGTSAPESQFITLAEVRDKAGFDAALPTYLPDGATLVSVQLLSDADGPRLVLQYQIGEEALTLQQWRTDPYHEPYGPADSAVQVQVGSQAAWTWEYKQGNDLVRALLWEQQGFTFIIHSTVSLDMLVQIAETIAFAEQRGEP